MHYEKRVCLLYCVFVIACSLLLARLYSLSRPETNKSVSVLDGQYTGRIDVCERSGFVYDRNGYLLSHDKVGKTALVNPAVCGNALEYADELSRFCLKASPSDIYEKIMDGIPFTVSLREDSGETGLRGVYVFDVYEENENIASHFMGYNNSEGDGVSGLRLAYSSFIGDELYSKVSASFDTNAKRISLSPFELESEKYLSGDGVVTTLDKPLQSFVDGLGEEIPSGAVVVTDVKSGEILALSSFPDYDAKNLSEVLNSDKGELVNRAVQSFTPGSVFKILVAASAIEKDSSLFDYKYTCEGKITVDGNVFRCHKHSGHGEISMSEAFSESCNTYFINLGIMLGLEEVAETARKTGLDTATAADFLHEERNGFLDVDNLSSGYLANISFGQGDLCLSPLDMTRIVIAAATGYLVPLSSVRGEIRDGEFFPNERMGKKRIFSDNTCEKLRQMMKKCVEEGTGRAARIYGANTGGKTATAQTGRFSQSGVEYVHKWFCGVYPIENPRISVCVLCDNETDENVSPGVIFGEICSFLLENNL